MLDRRPNTPPDPAKVGLTRAERRKLRTVKVVTGRPFKLHGVGIGRLGGMWARLEVSRWRKRNPEAAQA